MTTSRHEQIMNTFAKRLKAARMRAGYTSAQQFAGALGMEPHSYRKYERGTAEPNFERLVEMCKLLDIDVNHLLPVNSDKTTRYTRASAA
jgi:transcriptional regulator with XRE-family HTH domain